MLPLFSVASSHDSAIPIRLPRLRAMLWWLVPLLLFIFLPRSLSFYVDALWFDSLGQSGVWKRIWQIKAALFLGFFVFTFALLMGAFTILQRAFGGFGLGGTINRYDGSPLRVVPDLFMRPLAWAVSLTWAFLAAASMAANWELWALYFFQSAPPQRDPVFQKPLGFLLFSWPVQQLLATWLLGIVVIMLLAALGWAAMAYISRLPRASQDKARHASHLATSLALAGVLGVWAWRVYLGRFATLWRGDETLTGPGHVEINVLLPGYLLLCGVLLLCALLALFNALRGRSPRVFGIALAAPILFNVGLGLAANYVSNFIVKPNQLQLQTPFIKRHIEATRRAYALDRVQEREFDLGQSVANFDLQKNPLSQRALDNVRLWDWRALQATLVQMQTLKPYYDFPDVDVDRYVVNGEPRQVMVAARELDVSRLPPESRNWVNERLFYTHGYGVVMNTVSDFTPESRPRFIVSEMPVRSTVPEIKITRPEIYFGQKTEGHVYVKTRQNEFNFPRGNKDSTTTYEGDGGLELGGFFRRLILAWTLGDLSKIPFSDAITPQTRVLFYRQIIERATRLAPFLQFDSDPYIVVGEDGRLVWMLDAYTTTPYYPYASHRMVGSRWANHLRNSVKVTVDAYEGHTQFYVFETDDPVAAAWQKAFPKLLKNKDEMPADLRSHVRYPEAMFRAQAELHGLYHTTDASVFFSRNDQWSVAPLLDDEAQDSPFGGTVLPGLPAPNVPGGFPRSMQPPMGNGNAGATILQTARETLEPIEPYYLLLPLPGGNGKTKSDAREEFVLATPFTPPSKPTNMVSWLAGRSDGANYGKLMALNFPREENVMAPQGIRSRINTDKFLSERLTLWDSPGRGSRVLWGNLLTLPIGRGVLCVQPLFLRSERSPIPELRLIILATQKKLVYAPTYAEALRKLLGDADALEPTQTSPVPNTGPRTPAPSNRKALIERAARELADYQTLTSQGKYGEAGRKLENLKRTLQQLQRNP